MAKTGAIIAVGAAVALLAFGLAGKATAAPDKFICPIDGMEFPTLAELEAHHAAQHPTIPIDINWQ